jgi:UDP-N-acetylglucosamine--N-acetylmuramyl-(pentapeptide) pyrophosphoryl-undecaprenol N-acetylglucosamine transferase
MKVVIVSGGTGGHIYPGIAIAEEMQDRDIRNEILFIGSENGLEGDIVSKERFSIRLIVAQGIQRVLSFKIFKLPFVLIKGFLQARGILKEFRPDAVISTGGYASFPVVAAAAALRIPIFLHEQNAVPGITNRLCQRFAKKVMLSFKASVKYFNSKKAVFTGNPVRQKVILTERGVARQKLGIDQKRKTILVTGGSQGARRINEVMASLVDFFAAEGIQVLHVTGPKDYEHVLSLTENKVLDIEKKVPTIKGKKKYVTITKYKLYHPMPYMYNIWDGIAASDIIISRAGGTAIAEILARGIPSILVPYPFAAERHQDVNAKELEAAGASVIIENDKFSEDAVKALVKELLSDFAKLGAMSKACSAIAHPEAARIIVDDIYRTLGIDMEDITKKVKKRTRTRMRKEQK